MAGQSEAEPAISRRLRFTKARMWICPRGSAKARRSGILPCAAGLRYRPRLLARAECHGRADVPHRRQLQDPEQCQALQGRELEDDVFCGPSCVFTNVNNPRAEIERKVEFRPTLVKRGATIGANATIVCGHHARRVRLHRRRRGGDPAMCRPSR